MLDVAIQWAAWKWPPVSLDLNLDLLIFDVEKVFLYMYVIPKRKAMCHPCLHMAGQLESFRELSQPKFMVKCLCVYVLSCKSINSNCMSVKALSGTVLDLKNSQYLPVRFRIQSASWIHPTNAEWFGNTFLNVKLPLHWVLHPRSLCMLQNEQRCLP